MNTVAIIGAIAAIVQTFAFLVGGIWVIANIRASLQILSETMHKVADKVDNHGDRLIRIETEVSGNRHKRREEGISTATFGFGTPRAAAMGEVRRERPPG